MRFRRLLCLSALGIAALAQSIAAASPLLAVQESVTVAVPPEVAWRAVKNFNDLGWHPAIVTTELTAGRNNEQLAIRSLTLKDGGKIIEQLREHDDAGRVQRYSILDSPLPVTDYDASITVTGSEGDTSIVTWQSQFRRKADSSSEVSDAALTEMITGIFSTGLTSLKSSLEVGR